MFMQFTMASMVIAQFTLVGLMALKQSLYGTPFLAPLIAFTVLFIIHVNAEVARVTHYLPTRDCVVIDTRNEGLDFEFVTNVYLQPALHPKEREPVEVGSHHHELHDFDEHCHET